MSVALTDFLIDVSDPFKLRSFEHDPLEFTSSYELGEEEKDAIFSRDVARIRYYARSTSPHDEEHSTAQFRGSLNPAVLTEIDPTVEIVTESNDQVAIGGHGLLFIDESGHVFRGRAIQGS